MKRSKFLFGAVLVAVFAVTSLSSIKYFKAAKTTAKVKANLAGFTPPLPSYSGKPCADKAGTPLPIEGSGACRGNASYSISLPTAGVELVYNSQLVRNFGFGVGWTVSSDEWVEKLSATTALLYSGDGSSIDLVFDATNAQWVAKYPTLFIDSFKVVPTDIYALQRRHYTGRVDTYRSTGGNLNKHGLISITNRRGTPLTITRTSTGGMNVVTNYFNQKNVYTWNADRTLASVSDYAGGLYRFTYDAAFNLIKVTYPNGNAYILNYKPGTSLLSQVTSPKGAVTKLEYYTSGTSTALSKITDYEGIETTYSYQASELGNGSVTVNSFGGSTTETIASSAGRTTIETHTNGNFTSKDEYDERWRLVKTTNFFGQVTTYNYFGTGPFVQSVLRPDGTQVTYTRDANGNVTDRVETLSQALATNITRDTWGAPTQVKVNNFTIGKTTYDAKGLPVLTLDATGAKNTYTYNASGLVTSHATPSGHTYTWNYDAVGNNTSSVDPSGITASRTFDSLGNVKSVTSNNGLTTSINYDNLGRVTAVNSASKGATQTATQSTTINRVIDGSMNPVTVQSQSSVGGTNPIVQVRSSTQTPDGSTTYKTELSTIIHP